MSLFKNLARIVVAPIATVAHVVDEVYVEPIADELESMAEGFGVKKEGKR
jgi:hypothetical protein